MNNTKYSVHSICEHTTVWFISKKILVVLEQNNGNTLVNGPPPQNSQKKLSSTDREFLRIYIKK